MAFRMLKDVFLHGEEIDLKAPARSTDATIFLFNFLQFLGIYRPEENKYRHILYSVLLNLVFSVYTPISFAVSYILLFDQMEMGDFLTSVQVFINEVLNVCKIAAMFYWIPQIRKLDVLLAKMDGRCVDEDEKRIILLYAKKGNRLLVYFAVMYHSYAISTLLSAIYMHKPLYSMYNWPLDWRRSAWELGLVTAKEFIQISFVCFQEVVNDSYAVIYMGILMSHLQALMLRISKIGYKPHYTKEDNTMELINCVLDHKNIIEFFNAIHSPISTTMFIQFLFTAVMVSITVVNIMFFASFGSAIASTFYVTSVLMESALCCYYANCLIDESDAFGNVIFHSNWVEQDARFRKILSYFLHRSQKTIVLTAGKLFPINMATFLSIAKFSFSLYTLLKEMEFGQSEKD